MTDRALHSPVSVYLTPTMIFYQVTQCFLPHIPDWSSGKGHNSHGGTEGRGGKDPRAPGGEHRPLGAEHVPQQPTAHSSLLFKGFSLSFPPKDSCLLK